MTTKQKAEELAGKLAALHIDQHNEARKQLVGIYLEAIPLVELLEAVEALKAAKVYIGSFNGRNDFYFQHCDKALSALRDKGVE